MSTKKRFFRQVKILMITIVLLFSIKSLTAQVACSSCTSNDFTFQNFYLGDVVGTPLTGSCTPGSPMTAYLWMQVTNSSTRYSLLVRYDFIETNPLTGVSTTNTVTNCLYNNVAIPSSLISLGTVSWTCGNSLTIDNFQMHWKQNSSIACFYDAPKCLCIPPTIIKAPVAANYSYAACNNGSTSTVNFTSAVVGGTAPFTYAWNFGDASISNSANPSHTYTNPGPYTAILTVTDNTGVTSTSTQTVTLPSQSVAPTIATTQPTCSVATGTKTVTAPVGSGITYSKDGVNYQASTIFSGLVPGSYSITSKNSAGCVSAITSGTINAQPSPPVAPTVTVTQPTCSIATGTITVNSPTGAGITYSIDGINYQSSTTFSGVVTGSHSVTAKSSVGCISAITTTIVNAQPATPAAPTVTITQPSCTVATGTITVNSPTGAGITYSIDGINYQSSTTFSGVVTGSHSVTAKSSVGCISAITTAIVNAQPATPTAPTVTITQPSCTVATGTITLNSPTGAGITYSIDGINYQSSTTFSGVATGFYSVTAKSSVGCVSAFTTATVNTQPVTPAAPTVSITQPTCSVSTGTITVTAPTGAGITYSKDGTNYQSSTIFSSLAAGTYSVTAKSSAGCISAITTAIVNAQPATPTAPTVTITQPSCTVATGTITVNSPTGAGITYSIDGINYQSSTTFSGVVTGSHSVTAKSSAGCISAITTAIVNAQPATPTAPTFTITQPSCTVATGTITVNSPTGAGITYSINGVNYQVSTTFANLSSGSYSVTAQASNGCVSNVTAATLNSQPALPSAPTISVNQPTCSVATGSITINSPIGAGITYSIDGVNYQSSTTFNSLSVGSYSVTSKSSAGCVSSSVTATINAQPITLSPAISPSGSVTGCLGGGLVLTSNSAASYQWYKDGIIISGATGQTYTPTSNGSYTVSVTSASGCASVSAATVVSLTTTSPAAINVNAGSPILCNGSTVQLCPLVWGYSNYQWYKDGYAIAGPTGVSSCITIDVTGIGSYTLAGTNGAGCWSAQSAPLVVSTTSTLPNPTITVSGSTTLCNGGSVVLQSSSSTGNLWFKNGNSTGAITQTYTVTESGDYSVLVSTATCSSAMSLITIVSGGATAGFSTANATNNCDSTIRFTSTSANTTSTWSFGDGTTATGNTITHQYATIGSFTVKQVVTNAGGCKDSIIQSITINSCPVAPSCIIVPGFNSISNTANGDSQTFVSTSTINNGNMTYYWDLGNGTNSTLINPTASYTTGIHTIKLVVTGSLGCKDSISKNITVTAACILPVASFSVNNANQCLAFNSFSFSNTSSGTAPSYTWSFGDGSANVTTTAASHSYASTNTYIVTLTATNSCGSNQSSQTVTVNTVPATPASISGATTIAAGINSTLSSATPGGVWSSNNTTVATVDGNGVVTANAAGTATISYTVSNACGNAQTTIGITVTAVTPPACIAPVADFTINNATQCLSGNAFIFTNTSTGTTPTYTWYFGDGISVASYNATHSYSASNTYNVLLTAVNTCGSTSITKSVIINNIPVTPSSISGSTNITTGTVSNFSSATIGGLWSSNNTSIATVDPNTGVVTGVGAGTATISYTVSNACGAANTTLAIIVTPSVTPPTCTAPVADFTINSAIQCLSGNAFIFTNTSTGTTPSYTWNYGDGSVSTTNTNANYSYTTANTYTVTLVATNACGSNQITKTVTVSTVPSTPSSISGATNITAGTTSNFSSATNGGVWSSDNTSVATVDANTGVVTGVAAGTAIITYTVSNACGTAFTTKSITVNTAVVVPPPVICNLSARFTINNVRQCVTDNSFVFTNTTTGGTAPFTYLWDLNDGTTATTRDVTKTYTNYGDHDVTLKVTDANGCVSHANAQQIYIGAKPQAAFSILTNTSSGASTTFISSSSVALGTMSYLWDLGNGQTSTLVNPTTNYIPAPSTPYTVKLIVSGWGTCKDTATQTYTQYAISSISVYPNPVLDLIQISFKAASATPTTVKIMDLVGRTLQVQTVTPISTGANVIATLNTRGLQSGSYIIYISDVQNGYLATKAILKQ